MIKFFRKVRYDLMEKNKTGRYLKYAIGEIVLVVIGILIALQINNWNEVRKSNQKTLLLLKEVQTELAFNITKANRVIEGYRRKDTLVYRVLNKEAIYEDYQTRGSMTLLIRNNRRVDIVNDAFTNLLDKQDSYAPKQADFISKLKELYGRHKYEVDIMDETSQSKMFIYINKLKNEKEWYYNNVMHEENSHENVMYLLTDPFYLNEVAHYQTINLQNHNRYTLIFRNNAIERYKELSDYLNIKKDTNIVKNYKNYENIVGTYLLNNSIKYEIKKQNGKYILEWQQKKDSTIKIKRNIYPDSKTYFTLGRWFGKFIYDENNNVTGFITSLGVRRSIYKKVNNLK
jgi:Family of unknown function (DUF6090)